MPELAKPEAAALLQALALRYAASDLSAADAAAFEARLAIDQAARDALSEAVRLSAAALGQSPPLPDCSFRAAVRDRLFGWWPGWLARRSYRGHPLTWAALGALMVASATLFALSLPEQEHDRGGTVTATPPIATTAMPAEAVAPTFAVAHHGPEPELVPIVHVSKDVPAAADDNGATPTECANPSVAEIWASLSKPEHVEKAHEEELRFRQKLKEMGQVHPGRAGPGVGIGDAREP